MHLDAGGGAPSPAVAFSGASRALPWPSGGLLLAYSNDAVPVATSTGGVPQPLPVAASAHIQTGGGDGGGAPLITIDTSVDDANRSIRAGGLAPSAPSVRWRLVHLTAVLRSSQSERHPGGGTAAAIPAHTNTEAPVPMLLQPFAHRPSTPHLEHGGSGILESFWTEATAWLAPAHDDPVPLAATPLLSSTGSGSTSPPLSPPADCCYSTISRGAFHRPSRLLMCGRIMR